MGRICGPHIFNKFIVLQYINMHGIFGSFRSRFHRLNMVKMYGVKIRTCYRHNIFKCWKSIGLIIDWLQMDAFLFYDQQQIVLFSESVLRSDSWES